MTTTSSGVARLDTIFTALRSEGRKGLMPFLVGGRPSLDMLPDLLVELDRSGASVIEVGIPFSDPIADGPVIAGAMHEALASGVTPARIFDAIGQARGSVSAGIVAMVSVSIVHRIGLRDVLGRGQDVGVDGFIFPDAPLEEAAPLIEAAADFGVAASLLIAPTTPPDRAARIAAASTGFIYMVARRGITGDAGPTPHDQLAQRIQSLRDVTDTPIACGFGIASPDDVRHVVHGARADAAIVGTALVQSIEREPDAVSAARALMTSLAAGLA